MKMQGWAGRAAGGFVFALALMLAMGAAACGEQGADATGGGAPVLEWISGGEVALSALVGGTDTAAIGFRNSGDKDLNFELSVESEWLVITPLDGKVEPGGEQELTLSAICPEEVRVYTAGVALQSNASPGGHVLVVHLNCTEPQVGALTVTVTGLPAGTAANIGVSGPGFETTLNETPPLTLISPPPLRQRIPDHEHEAPGCTKLRPALCFAGGHPPISSPIQSRVGNRST